MQGELAGDFDLGFFDIIAGGRSHDLDGLDDEGDVRVLVGFEPVAAFEVVVALLVARLHRSDGELEGAAQGAEVVEVAGEGAAAIGGADDFFDGGFADPVGLALDVDGLGRGEGGAGGEEGGGE